MGLIVTFLAPIFLGVAGGDVALARAAAAETVRDYRARNLSDLLAIAQIIAYGLAALGSLSLSMADDLSLGLTLRLRGNANACTRSAEQNRRALSPCRDVDAIWEDLVMDVAYEPPVAPEPTFIEPEGEPERNPFLNEAASELLAEESKARLRQAAEKNPNPAPATTTPVSEKRLQDMWTIVRAKEAAEITANPPALPTASITKDGSRGRPEGARR